MMRAGAARVATARPDLTLGLPRRLSRRGDSGREAALTVGEPDTGLDPAAYGVPLERARLFIFDPERWAAWMAAQAAFQRLGGFRWVVCRIAGYEGMPPPIGWEAARNRVNELRKAAADDLAGRLRDGRLLAFARPGIGGAWRVLDRDQAPDLVAHLRPAPRPRGLWVTDDVKCWLPHLHDTAGLPADLAARLYGPVALVEKIEQARTGAGGRALSNSFAQPGARPTPSLPPLLAELEVWFAAELGAGRLVEAAGGDDGVPLFRQPPPPAGRIEGWPEPRPRSDLVAREAVPIKPSTIGAETACLKWLIGELKAGRRQVKGKWEAEAREHERWPSLSGEAWGRIWSRAREQFPDIGKAGRPPENQKG
jgi:hypothetical protein